MAICIGGPLDGRTEPDYSGRPIAVPSAKYMSYREQDGASLTDEHIYKWEDGRWVYQYSDYAWPFPEGIF